jgi:hypothetical protein
MKWGHEQLRSWADRFSNRGNSKCQSPKVGTLWIYPKKHKEVTMPRASWVKRTGDEVWVLKDTCEQKRGDVICGWHGSCWLHVGNSKRVEIGDFELLNDGHLSPSRKYVLCQCSNPLYFSFTCLHAMFPLTSQDFLWAHLIEENFCANLNIIEGFLATYCLRNVTQVTHYHHSELETEMPLPEAQCTWTLPVGVHQD